MDDIQAERMEDQNKDCSDAKTADEIKTLDERAHDGGVIDEETTTKTGQKASENLASEKQVSENRAFRLRSLTVLGLLTGSLLLPFAMSIWKIGHCVEGEPCDLTFIKHQWPIWYGVFAIALIILGITAIQRAKALKLPGSAGWLLPVLLAGNFPLLALAMNPYTIYLITTKGWPIRPGFPYDLCFGLALWAGLAIAKPDTRPERLRGKSKKHISDKTISGETDSQKNAEILDKQGLEEPALNEPALKAESKNENTVAADSEIVTQNMTPEEKQNPPLRGALKKKWKPISAILFHGLIIVITLQVFVRLYFHMMTTLKFPMPQVLIDHRGFINGIGQADIFHYRILWILFGLSCILLVEHYSSKSEEEFKLAAENAGDDDLNEPRNWIETAH